MPLVPTAFSGDQKIGETIGLFLKTNFTKFGKQVSKYVDLYSMVIVNNLSCAECTSIERTNTF